MQCNTEEQCEKTAEILIEGFVEILWSYFQAWLSLDLWYCPFPPFLLWKLQGCCILTGPTGGKCCCLAALKVPRGRCLHCKDQLPASRCTASACPPSSAHLERNWTDTHRKQVSGVNVLRPAWLFLYQLYIQNRRRRNCTSGKLLLKIQ